MSGDETTGPSGDAGEPIDEGPEPVRIFDEELGGDDTTMTGGAATGSPSIRSESSIGLPWRLVLFLALATLIVIFAVQNTQVVQVEFLGWIWSLPLVIVILIAVVVSIILDEIMGAILRKRRLRRRREKDELARLRTLQ